MEYRKLGRTGLQASVIGFGAEWIGKMEQAEVNAMAARGAAAGINIVDCWMSDPAVRSALGEALAPAREEWIIQGHVGSTWQDGQYVRTRDMALVRPAFDDLLARLRTDHVEIGMIHYVDACGIPAEPLFRSHNFFWPRAAFATSAFPPTTPRWRFWPARSRRSRSSCSR